jgi:hypothetical protein
MVRRSAPASSRWEAELCLLCRIRHRRHYAEFRTMPNGFVPSWRRFGKISLDAFCNAARFGIVR